MKILELIVALVMMLIFLCIAIACMVTKELNDKNKK